MRSVAQAGRVRLPPLGSRVRVSVTPCWFCGEGNWVWVGFSRGISRFPSTNFIPPCVHTHFINYVSFQLRGAMGKISNFYNLSARLLIFNTHIPPILQNTHTSKFCSCLSDTFWNIIFSFLKKGLFSKSISSDKF